MNATLSFKNRNMTAVSKLPNRIGKKLGPIFSLLVLFSLAATLTAFFVFENIVKGPSIHNISVQRTGFDRSRHVKVRQSNDITFTHLFSSFVPETNKTKTEIDAVVNSWRIAARAAKRKGINVEYVDAVLPWDIESVPDLSNVTLEGVKVVPLKKYVRNEVGVRLPTVGEIFRAGKEHGTGKWLVYTNADIALVQDFYSKVDDFLTSTTDYLNKNQQNMLREKLYEAKKRCLVKHRCVNAELCEADSRVIYENLGGIPSIYKKFAVDIALLLLQNVLEAAQQQHKWICDVSLKLDLNCLCNQAKSQLPSMNLVDIINIRKQILVDIFRLFIGRQVDFQVAWRHVGKSIASWDEGGLPVLNSSSWEPKVHHIGVDEKVPETAMTITRLDLPFETYIKMRGSSILQTIGQYGKMHPGNDCFILPRSRIPSALTNMVHPVGLRPWGMWLPSLISWDEGMAWRRVIGTTDNPFTYHVGVGLWRFGRGSDNWKKKVISKPQLFLFLVSHWYKITNGKFGELFDVPSYCSNLRYWRDDAYCQSGQSTHCRGVARFACSKYNHKASRDVKTYLDLCYIESQKKAMPLKQPMCDFCNFLIAKLRSGNFKQSYTCETDDVEKEIVNIVDN